MSRKKGGGGVGVFDTSSKHAAYWKNFSGIKQAANVKQLKWSELVEEGGGWAAIIFWCGLYESDTRKPGIRTVTVFKNWKIWFCLQLAKEREEEMKEAREKEESLKAKKKSDPNELKVYTKGVGKFLNPAIKKQAR